MAVEKSRCSLLRRICAIFYDSLLVFSILFFATLILLPVTGGDAISSNNIFYTVYLLLCAYLYFCWQWIHGGQTLGMKAWKITLIRWDDNKLTWTDTGKRFLFALASWLTFGAGFLWALFDREGYTFHDRYSKTILLVNTSHK